MSLVKWLTKKLNSSDIKNIYDHDEFSGCYTKYSIEDFYFYFTDNDIDCQLNDKNKLMLNNLEHEDMINSIECFGKTKILIPTGTNRRHAYYLFKNLVNCTENNGLYINNTPVFSADMKEAFYKFCLDNST